MAAPVDAQLRPLEPADLPDLLEMWVAAWADSYPQIDFDARRGWFTHHVTTLQREGACALVATKGDAITGFLLIDPPTHYLDQIVVATTRQGEGIADLLLAQARVLSPSRIELHVNQDNARAIRFYERNGFARVGESANVLSGRATYRMRWEAPGKRASHLPCRPRS